MSINAITSVFWQEQDDKVITMEHDEFHDIQDN